MFERDVIRRLEAATIDYFVTGSVALGAWATFRQTNDVDLVVHLSPAQYESVLRPAFEPDYLVNPLSPHGVKSMGAVISVAEAMKADMIVRAPDGWGESAFARRATGSRLGVPCAACGSSRNRRPPCRPTLSQARRISTRRLPR